MKSKKTLIAITAGDPAGIGPEVVLKALAKKPAPNARLFIIGDLNVLNFYKQRYRISLKLREISNVDELKSRPGEICVLQAGESYEIKKLKPGTVEARAGNQAVQALLLAAKLAMSKQIDAIVTAPVQKEAMHRAGYPVEGQTELFGRLAKVKRYEMLIQAGKLRVLLLTRHLSLKKALGLVKRDRILDKLRLGDEFLRKWGVRKPKLAVAGLNPHAGEQGIFGRDEIDEIAPAIAAAQKEGLDVHGPFSPDTVFRRASKGEFDLVLALYHDQAFIPVKMIGFDDAVTTIVGLPFLRVSVIHGSAFDIAGKGIADERNMIEAIRAASVMASKRSS